MTIAQHSSRRRAPSQDDCWYVSVGNRAVGPVTFALVAEGIEAGRVPTHAFVRHAASTVWRPVTDLDGKTRWNEPPATATDDDVEPALAWSTDDLREDLRVFMSAAVARSGADAAIVLLMSDDHAEVVAAHGPDGGSNLVGTSTSRASSALLARLCPDLVGSRRLPISVGGRLVAVLHVGRRSIFTEAEIASLETLAFAVADKLAGLTLPDA